MSEAHPPPGEAPRDAATRSEIARDETVVFGAPSVRYTDDGIREVGFDDPELRPLPPDKLHYHVPHPDPHPESHEHSDVPIRPLVITLAAIAGTCLFTFVLLYFVFWQFKGQQQAQERPRTAVKDARPDVPEPRLQGVPGFSENHPTQDRIQMQARYKAELEGYAPNDGTQTARIPIDKAMDLALQKNMFPVAKPGAASQPSTPRGGGK
jgi:hypothetical protein